VCLSFCRALYVCIRSSTLGLLNGNDCHVYLQDEEYPQQKKASERKALDNSDEEDDSKSFSSSSLFFFVCIIIVILHKFEVHNIRSRVYQSSVEHSCASDEERLGGFNFSYCQM